MKKAVVSVLAVLTLFLCVASPASAKDDPVPKNVMDFVENDLVKQIQSLDFRGQGDETVGQGFDFSGTLQLGNIVRKDILSSEFQQAVKQAQVTRVINEWIISLHRDGKPVGTALVWIDSGTVGLAGVDNDVELATLVDSLPKGQQLIHYPAANEYYSYDGKDFYSLGKNATAFAGDALSVDEFQQAIVARVKFSESQAPFGDDLVGGLGSDHYSTYVQSAENSETANWWRVLSIVSGGAAGVIILAALLRGYARRKNSVT